MIVPDTLVRYDEQFLQAALPGWAEAYRAARGIVTAVRAADRKTPAFACVSWDTHPLRAGHRTMELLASLTPVSVPEDLII